MNLGITTNYIKLYRNRHECRTKIKRYRRTFDLST